MNTAALQEFRRKLKTQDTVGLWVTLESPSITEMGVGLGVDWIVVDAEHGHLDWKEIVEHVRAAVRSTTVVLVRVSELNGAAIKRALDIGADGVVVPSINTADQLRQAVAFARYPPAGARGVGAERATAWGQCFAEHAADANECVLVVPMLETVRAKQNLDSLLAVDGVDVYFLGPADYSASAGFAGQWEGGDVAQQLLEMKDAIQAGGKFCGIIGTSCENLRQRRRQGFRLLGLGSDAGLLLRSLHETLASLGRDRNLTASIESNTLRSLDRPPRSARPDRREVIIDRGKGETVEIAPGVVFECQTGAFNHARNLTAGIVRFEPQATLPYHLHTFSESITLLEGEAEVSVEGRAYRLTPLDNVTLPPRLAHQVRNISKAEPALFHVAMNLAHLSRTLTEDFSLSEVMPEDSTGVPGAEHVTRYRLAPHFEAGPNTRFIDYFNSNLVAGLEMSGGYGEFGSDGRLPAHFHDFDESICIIGGVATCIVEGRQYEMSDYCTALQPRGRVHYFANHSSQPMKMIWVYAGPTPKRIVVNERCTTLEGTPWPD